MKTYKYLGASLQGFSVVCWFGILVLQGSAGQAFFSILSILLLTTGVSIAIFVGFAHKDKESFVRIMAVYQNELGVVIWIIIWFVPALVIGPWTSFLALLLALTLGWAGMYFQSRWIEEELRKQRSLIDISDDDIF